MERKTEKNCYQRLECTLIYNRYVGWSVGPSVGQSVGRRWTSIHRRRIVDLDSALFSVSVSYFSLDLLSAHIIVSFFVTQRDARKGKKKKFF